MSGADTALKRSAMLDFGSETTSPGLADPTGVSDAKTRYQSLWLYVPGTFLSAPLGSPRRGLLLNGASASRIKWPGGATTG